MNNDICFFDRSLLNFYINIKDNSLFNTWDLLDIGTLRSLLVFLSLANQR